MIFSRFCTAKSAKTNEPERRRVHCDRRRHWMRLLTIYADTTGIRDLEQAAEHIAANALYQIEVEHKGAVTYTREMVNELLG